MTTRKKVLITGAAGLVGGVLRDGLADRYELSTIDVRPLVGDHLQASMADLDAVRPAFEGKDVVIDLASHATGATPWTGSMRTTFPAHSTRWRRPEAPG